MKTTDNRYLACPCIIIDRPCNPACSCVNTFSSFGCMNCSLYGSFEQRKAKAEYLNAIRIEHESNNHKQ